MVPTLASRWPLAPIAAFVFVLAAAARADEPGLPWPKGDLARLEARVDVAARAANPPRAFWAELFAEERFTISGDEMRALVARAGLAAARPPEVLLLAHARAVTRKKSLILRRDVITIDNGRRCAVHIADGAGLVMEKTVTLTRVPEEDQGGIMLRVKGVQTALDGHRLLGQPHVESLWYGMVGKERVVRITLSSGLVIDAKHAARPTPAPLAPAPAPPAVSVGLTGSIGR